MIKKNIQNWKITLEYECPPASGGVGPLVITGSCGVDPSEGDEPIQSIADQMGVLLRMLRSTRHLYPFFVTSELVVEAFEEGLTGGGVSHDND